MTELHEGKQDKIEACENMHIRDRDAYRINYGSRPMSVFAATTILLVIVNEVKNETKKQ